MPSSRAWLRWALIFAAWRPHAGALYADDPVEDTLEWAPVQAGAARSGDLGFTIGLAVYTDRELELATPYYSKYLSIWAREPDGAFRYVADLGSSRPPPAP